MKKQLKNDMREVLGKYDSCSLDELVRRCTEALEGLPEEQRATVKFGIEEEHYQYDSEGRTALFMTFAREETDDEQTKRLTDEKRAKELRTAHDEREFKRLQKIFGNTKL